LAFGTPHRLSAESEVKKPNFENLFEYQLNKSKNQIMSPVTATTIPKNGVQTITSKSPSKATHLDSFLETPGSTLLTPSFFNSLNTKLVSPTILSSQINKKCSSDIKTPQSTLKLLASPNSFLNSETEAFPLTPSAFDQAIVNQQIDMKNVKQEQINTEIERPTPELKLPDFNEMKKKKKENEARKKIRIKRKKRKDEQPDVPPPLDDFPASQKVLQKNNLREWKVIFRENFIDLKSNLLTKTRCEEPIKEVSDKMYSSLKYEIRHVLTGTICGTEAFLLGRIFVVDSLTGTYVKKKR